MKRFLTIIALLSIGLSSCQKEDVTPEFEGKASITFDAVVGAKDFALNTDFTIANKNWNFTQFRYWVSQVTLVKSNGEEYVVPNSFYLIEENVEVGTNSEFNYPANKRETVELLNIPAGEYKGIKFGIGVTERYNNNLTLQAGELSQLNGMTNVSWMWATSYIFSSIKGKVTEGANNKSIIVETGLNANYINVSLDFQSNVRMGSSKPTSIVINADVSKVVEDIDIMSTPVVGAAQGNVMSKVAENYATKAFSVKSVN